MTEQTTETTTYDPFTDPESLVVTYRGARLALYYVDGDNNGGEYIAVEGFTPEVAGELLDELTGLPVLAADRLEDYFNDQAGEPRGNNILGSFRATYDD
jgi:hypothetical protein